MTSQSWLTPSDVDRTVWWHYLVVFVPEGDADPSMRGLGTLYVGGGSNREMDVGRVERIAEVGMVKRLALVTRGITAALFQVPNQPLIFASDASGARRSEDSLIAWGWEQFLLGGGKRPEWLPRLPMTKAAVRGMDTIGVVAPERFVVVGASKRGWTSWTTAAVDPRVCGVIPIVMDLLNFRPSVHHHYRSYGGWSFAFADYVAASVTTHLDTPQMRALLDIVDPYVYRARLTMAKYIVSTTGDEFFLPDDSRFFLSELPGTNYLRMLPNCEHSMVMCLNDVIKNTAAFIMSLRSPSPSPHLHPIISTTTSAAPHVDWVVDYPNGIIQATSYSIPKKATAWCALTISDKRRDFRLLALFQGKPVPQPVVWRKLHLALDDVSRSNWPFTYTHRVPKPLRGWRACFVELTFEGYRGVDFVLTSPVSIMPDTLPFPDCSGEDCGRQLV
eukprot:jgi/Chlat1/7795/Chrsp66S07250